MKKAHRLFAVAVAILAVGGCRAEDAAGTVTVPADQPLPKPATWVFNVEALPDPLPPRLRDAHRVAADYLQLPPDEVFFVEVEQWPWGDLYVFAKEDRWNSAEVHVPSLTVWGGEVVPPWKPGGIDDLTFPLSYEDAARVAQGFVVDRLGLDPRELELQPDSAPRDPDKRRRFTFLWARRIDGVLVPGGAAVHIDVNTGEAIRFSHSDIPLRVGLKPSLSREQAIERALRYLFAWAPRGEREERKRKTRIVEAFLAVDYFPHTYPWSERPTASRQRLVWAVVLEPPLPEQWADWHPTRATYWIDAHNGRLRHEATRPMYPRVEELEAEDDDE